MHFLKKIIKNKTIVLILFILVISFTYIWIQKAINNYNFNNDIIITDNKSNEAVQDVAESGFDEISSEGEGVVPDEETDLVLEEGETADDDESKEQVDKEGEVQNQIYVYVTGEVNIPGVVILDEGSRIVDAINAAGGTTIKADISKVNLVYVLNDGMKVNIPNDKDLKDNPNFEYITMNSGDGSNGDYAGKEPFENGNSSEGEGSSNKKYIVNINTATQTELETLPGIGPSLALKIINYRKENGKFSSIEQIKEVSGIGESKFDNIKKYITI